MDDDIPYLLLTPGPLTTSRTVKSVMMRDFCTWDDDYNSIVQEIRAELVRLAGGGALTAVLMQGSGTFSVEATIGTAVPRDGKLLVVNNGAYGARMAQIARTLGIACTEISQPETEQADLRRIEAALEGDPAITHLAMVHCETTTGMLNPAMEAGALARRYGKSFILDAMSSFGGIPTSMDVFGSDWLISSANKCIQGVPGFGFVVARREAIEATKGHARSLSLDLYDQWREMEEKGGKWRFTSPTHTVRAFAQALQELRDEGGVEARHARYTDNARRLVQGYERIGFRPLLGPERRSPVITSFLFPSASFSFDAFYAAMKRRRFVLYPGKISQAATFRVGTIGHVFPEDIDLLVKATGEVVRELGITFAHA
ncbi:MAG: 2-aminoethylphosphonate--pyruvate transaminase [Chloroflexi bacterium]|nr:2-aminoethylphosphonate--pyruvate transaminase [Chloroflexota bacterium]